MAKTKKAAHEHIKLHAEPRTMLGKKVKRMRKEGKIPSNVFGPDFKSVSITVTMSDFAAAYRVAHETGIIDIDMDGTTVPTLVKTIQRDPISGNVLHVDFRKIDLKQKIETTVPVAFVGESEAVNHKNGVLITQNDHLTVEALPEEIPAQIEIDLSALKEIGDEIKVSDLSKSDSYTVQDDPETVIVSVTAHKEESVEPETTAAAPEVITEKAEEGESAEAPAEEQKEG